MALGFLGELKYSPLADRLTSAAELCARHQPQGEEELNWKASQEENQEQQMS